MSGAKKIQESEMELPTVPSESLLRLVKSDLVNENNLPQTPAVRVQKNEFKRNWKKILGSLTLFAIVTAAITAGLAYLIAEGKIDVKPGMIKSFFKSLTFK